ncbi:hypothetical protein COCC4DRAFT_33233 [Bipolaris maydis ATCC 48331]|uniref:Uncharacterized protein n=2 Tax=Cochliobolus heterostrophus TaxID=5016 RepID=M2UHE2_COCH5|nr:uncharacterized protein COCC4DRAFT_33233 [Bipolaris maydis ATCC 48331]EMD97859.1 hypothetical protein COCHEDRAFT_1019135 [Bipolaris maydis C5]KAH7564455.1 hypothetical protein BM1_01502 [Bipolaris maydis]ENI02744.1 hypothetical protein COCC4DRAFT_33233 [Bipolaris maydis ATCC 48331]KAJ5031924.1 hypothetical protein J3E73DRAFT_271148 [Bipolaris maydis]KAJ6202188.1 hypothetical protein J3E72DRAFT_292760 [Bipolaris maydis]
MPLLPQMVIAARQVFEDETPHEISAFKYYFLLIGVLVVMIAFLLWYLHRRTKHKTEFCEQDSEQPPARDIQTWSQPRRFMYGIYEASNSFLSRQSEGLDQNGDAPPPYQPKSRAPTIDVEIPLPTLSRSLSQRSQRSQRSQPPQYPSSTGGVTSTTERQQLVHS